MITKLFWNVSCTFTRLYGMFQLLKYQWEEVIPKNLQNRKKYEKSKKKKKKKKEEGGDAKHVYFFYSALYEKVGWRVDGKSKELTIKFQHFYPQWSHVTLDIKSVFKIETPINVDSYDQFMPSSHVVCRRVYIFVESDRGWPWIWPWPWVLTLTKFW